MTVVVVTRWVTMYVLSLGQENKFQITCVSIMIASRMVGLKAEALADGKAVVEEEDAVEAEEEGHDGKALATHLRPARFVLVHRLHHGWLPLQCALIKAVVVVELQGVQVQQLSPSWLASSKFCV